MAEKKETSDRPMVNEDSTPAVATEQQNQQLEHSVEGATTRDDALDLGVPMLPGSPEERQGPEDAAGGLTRGDYSARTGDTYNPHTTELIPVAERVPGGPTTRLVPQRPIFSETGEVAGVKGGVDPSTKV